MPFTGPAEDRQAIRELYDFYADASCRGDRADFLACWTQDGSWWTHYFDLQGREAIATQYDQLMGAVQATIFSGQMLSIEVAGDTARCRAICSERLLMGEHGQHVLTGIYHDELRREGGQWLFHRRIYKVVTEEMLPPYVAFSAG